MVRHVGMNEDHVPRKSIVIVMQIPSQPTSLLMRIQKKMLVWKRTNIMLWPYTLTLAKDPQSQVQEKGWKINAWNDFTWLQSKSPKLPLHSSALSGKSSTSSCSTERQRFLKGIASRAFTPERFQVQLIFLSFLLTPHFDVTQKYGGL